MREDLSAKPRLQLAQPDEMTPEHRRIGVLAESRGDKEESIAGKVLVSNVKFTCLLLFIEKSSASVKFSIHES